MIRFKTLQPVIIQPKMQFMNIADKYGAVHTTASSEVKTNDNGELVW